MKIVTTPMCEEILRLAGIHDYLVNKNPDKEDGDFAILLSESKVMMDSMPIKLNTASQIFNSIKKISTYAECELSNEEILLFFEDYKLTKKYLNNNFKHDIKVKVLSKFLKDIVLDMGFNISASDYDYVIYPDYLREDVNGEDKELVEIPTHNFASKNPFERVELRYSILEKLI